MTRYFRRRRPGRHENLVALALGVGVGVTAGLGAFYLSRILLGREVLGPPREARASRSGAVESSGSRQASAPGRESRAAAGSPVQPGRRPEETAGRSSGP